MLRTMRSAALLALLLPLPALASHFGKPKGPSPTPTREETILSEHARLVGYTPYTPEHVRAIWFDRLGRLNIHCENRNMFIKYKTDNHYAYDAQITIDPDTGVIKTETAITSRKRGRALSKSWYEAYGELILRHKSWVSEGQKKNTVEVTDGQRSSGNIEWVEVAHYLRGSGQPSVKRGTKPLPFVDVDVFLAEMKKRLDPANPFPPDVVHKF